MAGYNVSALVDYTNEQNFPILRASILGAKSASLFTLQTGIKTISALNLMDVDVVLQSDAVGSAVEGGGEVKFSQRMITVAPIAVREFFDPKVLNAKYLQSQIKAGSSDNELVFEQEIMDTITAKVAAQIETAIWQGDKALTGNATLKHFDGYNKLIDAATGVTVTSATTFTSANAMANVDAVYAAIPVAVLDADDMAIYMGRDYFRTYTTALKNANMFHYNADSTDGEIVVPGTAIKVIALNGLNASKRVVAGRKSNFFIGVDLDGEEDTANTVYIDAIEKVKIKIGFKYGVQIAFPSEVTVLKVTA
jgi:hypothetical protein